MPINEFIGKVTNPASEMLMQRQIRNPSTSEWTRSSPRMPDENRTSSQPHTSRSRQPGLPLRLVREAHASERTTHAPTQGRVGVDLRARAPSTSGPVRQQTPKRNQRRHGWLRRREPPSAPYSAGTPAPATPAPRPPRRRRFALIFLLLVDVGLVALVIWALTAPRWQVRWVQVEGTNDATLVRAIQALPLTGCNIFRCDTDQRTALVAALPAVAHADVHAAYPDGLIVAVTPRHPALLWQIGDQALVVADDGTVLGTREGDPAYNSITLQEIVDPQAAAFGGQLPLPGARLDVTVSRMAGQLRSNLAAAAGSGWTLSYTGDQGFVAENATGQQIIFGQPEDAVSTLSTNAAPAIATHAPSADDAARGAQVQLAELAALEAQLSGRHTRAILIDLRWGAHPYYRLTG